jgi:hypothetical protein
VGASYKETIEYELGVSLLVDFWTEGTEVTDYSLVLLFDANGRTETIRVYDSAHGFNELHRYSRSGGKQDGVEVHSGTLGEGMRSAQEEIKRSYISMIEGWKR